MAARRRSPLYEALDTVCPDSSMTLGWARSSGSAGAIEDWSAPGSQRLIVRLVADEDGLRLDVARS